MKRLIAICIKGYEGDDTSLIVGAPNNTMYAVYAIENKKTGFVDGGYRSLEELKESWPGVETEVAVG